MQVRVELPEGVRCAVALSYDLEMCAGYSPVLINHGRIMRPLRDYTLRLCTTAEAFGVQLHFFYVANGLEEPDIGYLREILRRGHLIDNHTYSHMLLSHPDPAQLGWELTTANREMEVQAGRAVNGAARSGRPARAASTASCPTSRPSSTAAFAGSAARWSRRWASTGGSTTWRRPPASSPTSIRPA